MFAVQVGVALDVNSVGISVGLVSTYPPTECGIASFSASLRSGMAESRQTSRGLNVLRLVDDGRDGPGREYVHEHRRGDRESLKRSIAVLNTYDTVLIQHEFGIFAGADGDEVLDLTDGVEVPIATTFHTVLDPPSAGQRFVMQTLIDESQRVIVMTETARRRLLRHHDVAPDIVEVISHGVDLRFAGPSLADADRPVVLTWGLIGPGKGLEVAIEACVGLTDLEPLPRYVIVGSTHPNIRRVNGEDYRHGLQAEVQRFGLEEIVEFDGRYLDVETLAALVRSADVVVLPYASVDQVTSGVLVEALAAGKPVIATSFPHSIEVLSSGAGSVVAHDDADELSHAIRRVLTDPDLAARMTREARHVSRHWWWPEVGRRYLGVLEGMARDVATGLDIVALEDDTALDRTTR